METWYLLICAAGLVTLDVTDVLLLLLVFPELELTSTCNTQCRQQVCRDR